MIEEGKISSFQMGIIMYPAIVATAILILPSITPAHAGRDMWLSPVWASITGFLTVYIVYRLNRLFPKETIIEYSKRIVGTIPAKLLGLLYLLLYFHMTGIVVREYGEFMVGSFFQRTPLFVIMGSMILVCALNVRGGVEVIARTAQFFVPIVVILFTCIVLLLIPDLDPRNMLPIMEHGLLPSLKGSVVPHGWFSEYILISFLLPYLSDRQKGLHWGMISAAAVMVTMVITNFASLFLFGEITAALPYPVMSAARYISLAEFFEHLEALVMAIWVAGTFMKISMFYYVLVLGTAQWTGLSGYRPLVLPIGLILVSFSFWVGASLQELVHFLSTVSPFYFLILQTVLPAILLMIALLRKKGSAGKGGK